jgi:hypothetical protein
MKAELTTERNVNEWVLGETLVHKKHGFKVTFKSLTTSIGQFRTLDDFQFSVDDFKKLAL